MHRLAALMDGQRPRPNAVDNPIMLELERLALGLPFAPFLVPVSRGKAVVAARSSFTLFHPKT